MVGRPKTSEQRDTRQAIVDAALELFSEHGYYGTSLRDLAKAVGVRESAIYHHFTNKEAIFDAVVFDFRPLTPAHTLLPALPTIDDVARSLEEWIARMLLHCASDREQKRFRIMLSDGMRLAGQGRINYFERMGAQRQPLIDLMAKCLEIGLFRAGDPELLASVCFAPVMLWRQLLILNPSHRFVAHPRLHAQQLVDQFLRGAAAIDRYQPPQRGELSAAKSS